MVGHVKKHFFYFWIGFWLLACLCIWGTAPQSLATTTHLLQVNLNNPYSFALELEVKCDWNNAKKVFDYHKFILAKPKVVTTILFPKYHNKCEIWPSHTWTWSETNENQGGEND